MCALLPSPLEITPLLHVVHIPTREFSNMYTYVSISSSIISHVLFFACLKGIGNVESLVEVYIL